MTGAMLHRGNSAAAIRLRQSGRGANRKGPDMKIGDKLPEAIKEQLAKFRARIDEAKKA